MSTSGFVDINPQTALQDPLDIRRLSRAPYATWIIADQRVPVQKHIVPTNGAYQAFYTRGIELICHTSECVRVLQERWQKTLDMYKHIILELDTHRIPPIVDCEKTVSYTISGANLLA